MDGIAIAYARLAYMLSRAKIEKVQKTATKFVTSCKGLANPETLKVLGIPTLKI